MKKLFLYLILNTLYLILFANVAEAGTIINRPLAIGLNKGLVGHWTFDGNDMIGDRTALDVSGNGNNGTLTNGPKPVAGKIGQALEFDGVDDLVNAAAASSLNDLGSISISMWVFPRSFGENNAILVEKNSNNAIGTPISGWILGLNGSVSPVRLQFSVDYNGTTNLQTRTDTAAFNLNVWQHIVLTWDGSAVASDVSLYRDGTKYAATGLANGDGSRVTDASQPLTIGNASDLTRTFDGLIDDVRVYNRVLSPDEIKRLYNLGGTFTINKSQSTGTLKDGLVGHWTFDGGDMVGESRALDASGNNNHGTLVNGPKKIKGKIGQALEFDGVLDTNFEYVEIGNAIKVDNSQVGTISAWIYIDTTSVIINSTILGYGGASEAGLGDQFQFRVVSAGAGTATMSFVSEDDTSGTNSLNGSTAFSRQSWQHVAIASDGSQYFMYLNGRSEAFSGSTNNGHWFADVTATSPVVSSIGFVRSDGNNTNPFVGVIDDVRIYNRALSPDEIKRLYNLGGTFTINKSQSTGTLSKGLVGHWTFDGGDMKGNTAYDLSGKGNNGTLTNGPTRVKGKIGQALEFKTTRATFVNMGDVLDFERTNPFTISVWVKPDILGSTNRSIVSKTSGCGLGYCFELTPTNLEFSLSNSVFTNSILVQSTNAVVDGSWVHLVVTYNGSVQAAGVTLYKNGVAIPSTVIFNNLSATTVSANPLNIGARNNSTNIFDGLIDDVRIYNRVLSPDEIKRLYNMGR